MSRTYATSLELFRDIYLTGRPKVGPWAKALDWTARRMLDRATITGNLSRAKRLRSLVDKQFKSGMSDEQHVAEHFDLYKLLSECFEVIADDVMLLSAFEIHTKARLLRKGYIIHQISKPDELRKRQVKAPVHVRTLRAAQSKGDTPQLGDTTIGISQLLKPKYCDKYPFDDTVRTGLRQIQERRNRIHFHLGNVWDVNPELLAVVDYLDSAIPQHKTARSSKSAKR